MNTLKSIALLCASLLAIVGCSDPEPSQNNATNNGGWDTSGTDPDTSGGDTSSADTSMDTAEDDADAQSSDTGRDVGNDVDPGDCVPSQQAWSQNARGHVEDYCANCHGETPDFGAPYSLLDYDELIAGTPGERKVDKMAQRLLDRTMPPPSSPQPDHVALDTLVEWATCGQQHPDHSDGLDASHPVWQAPEEPPANADAFDVTADEWEVSPTTIDSYRCFTVDAPIEEPRLVQRIDPVVDDSRVLHHTILALDKGGDGRSGEFSCGGFPPGDSYLYAWGPGQLPIQFEDGGMLIEPGDRFVLQIHYNNGAGAQNVADSSGVRIHHTPTGGKRYYMRETGVLFFALAPGRETSVTGECRVDRETNIVASWPHMHEIGTEFESVIERDDGTEETLISLTGWSFEAQLIYDTPMTLYPGDTIKTTCTYYNDRDQITTAGTGTKDEMCFNFFFADQPICNGL
jgi:hypothetical protein